jgi:Inner membrane component of T3SS, cytoplasmic domain/Tetratricopeptide repeat
MLEEDPDDGAIGPVEPGAVEDEPTVVLRKRARSRPVAMTDRLTAVLTVLKGRHCGQIIELHHGENLVGRGRGVHLHLLDRGVSRHHARLVVDAQGKVDLFDLGSTNGTFVNGERTTKEALRVGDRIRVGLEAVLELSHVPTSQRPSTPRPVSREDDAPLGRRGRVTASSKVMRAKDVPTTMARPGSAAPCWGYSQEAIDAYRRLLEIRRKRMGAHHSSVAEMLETMGVAFRDNGHHQQAIEYLNQALEIHKAQDPPALRATARTLTRIAHCELALGRPQAAVIKLERAEQLLRASQATPVEIGCVSLSLSQALWSLKGDPNRCMTLARLARDAFASGGTTSMLHHDALVWIRTLSDAHPHHGKHH